MEISRAGSQPSVRGSTEWFTGTVRIDPLFPAVAPARAAGNAVTFEPGARTAWHTHPLGQVLIVSAGTGRVQRWAARSRRSGRATWSGSSRREALARRAPTTAMTHIAIQEALDGKAVEWMEKVSDDQYGA